jgi:hypothetical protein
MSSEDTVRFTSNGTTVSRNCDDLEKEVRGYRETLDKSLAAAAGPVLELPNSLTKIIGEGRLEDAKKIGVLTKGIARDVDQLIKEKKEIDADCDRLLQSRPSKKGKLSDHYTQVLLTGSRYLALSQKATDTVVKSIDDYADLVSPESKEQAEA